MASSKVDTVSSAVDAKQSAADGDEEEFERSSWGGQLEFILTCIGFAVGLGNVWRFPYLVYENGGGAFLIPYFLMLVFVGLPLFYMECAFGQFSSLSPISAYSLSPVFKGVGVAGIIVAAYIVLYYNIIVAWCMYYFFASMNTELPWVSCNNWWNTVGCIEPGIKPPSNMTNITFYTSSEEYYYNYVLRITDGLEDIGGIRWQLALLLALAWTIIFLVIVKGIESLGKVSYFVSLFPYVLLTIMLIRGVTLPGASLGIEFYLTPDFSRLLEAKVWADAATQIFYSLGISMGGLIAMSSFNDFNNNIKRDSLIVPLVNCGTSFYAGFVIFSVLGYMAETKGVPISEVAAEGPGLVFVVYPEGLATMPGAPIWAVLFFFMMVTLGFSSQFSTCEGVVSAFVDEFPEILAIGMRPIFLRATVCVTFFLLGLPMVCEGGFYLFNIMDLYCAGYTLLIVAFGEIMVFQYVYGYNRFAEDIALMLGKKPGIFFQVCWRFLTPGIIFVVFISKCIQQTPLQYGDYVYPQWGNTIAWCIVAFPVVVMFAVFFYRYCTKGGFQAYKEASSPTKDWGPARKKDQKGVYAMPDATTITTDRRESIPPPYWLSGARPSATFSSFNKTSLYNGNASIEMKPVGSGNTYTYMMAERPERSRASTSKISVEAEINTSSQKSRTSDASQTSIKKDVKKPGNDNKAFVGEEDGKSDRSSSIESSP